MDGRRGLPREVGEVTRPAGLRVEVTWRRVHRMWVAVCPEHGGLVSRVSRELTIDVANIHMRRHHAPAEPCS